MYTIFSKLKERLTQSAGTLSGGEQQMCAIGRGVMSAPRLLMIDELSLGLSPFLVEQNVMTSLEVSQYAYLMDTGRTVNYGPSDTLLRDPAVCDAYLGVMNK